MSAYSKYLYFEIILFRKYLGHFDTAKVSAVLGVTSHVYNDTVTMFL